jgi:hypothetical protein
VGGTTRGRGAEGRVSSVERIRGLYEDRVWREGDHDRHLVTPTPTPNHDSSTLRGVTPTLTPNPNAGRGNVALGTIHTSHNLLGTRNDQRSAKQRSKHNQSRQAQAQAPRRCQCRCRRRCRRRFRVWVALQILDTADAAG